MADALCGPSNALQNFQKHSTVDRTLQQDRLVARHGSPAQGFRSTQQPNGLLDSEFDAFQAGRPAPPPQDFQHFAPQFAQPPPQFSHAPQAPDWAADFQRLSVASPPPQALQHQRPQAANAASAWHQDFMRQQTPVVQAPVMQQNTYNSMGGYNMGGFGSQSYMQPPAFQPSQIAQGKQPKQEAIPAFDEAAFEQAFAQAQQDMMDVASQEQKMEESRQANPEVLGATQRPGEMDPLIRIRETQPDIYSAIQVWSETGLGRTEEAVAFLDKMAGLEQNGELVQDPNEATWIVDSLQRIVQRDAPTEVQTRAERLITAIQQRLMSQYPLFSSAPLNSTWLRESTEEELHRNAFEQPTLEQQPEPQKEEQQQPQRNEEDEMAETAGRLLERVADNTSEKFQNSQFLSLMRKLRDREVKVQEDKIVEVDGAGGQSTTTAPISNTTPSTSQSESQPQSQQQPRYTSLIPPIDREILNHAATDFETPIYSSDSPPSASQ
ncbi:hypothetical protein T440DRAFT_463543 [Plenodomus tracheiphilus IPT5]|uniref:Peroxin 20 n=1 Tax=Plenodomus tracheiphilus IPT5 TaxID=1408161 RepID=A0A6A7BL18_9PLEO|nr:hypothetical protein T440DRAFT_463543 [Plenodomus tracheiphilus IPT5]